MSLIVDRTQFDAFLDILPELQRDEVYFLSLSARNKYLTDEERVEYELGNREKMFSRHTALDKTGIEDALAKMQAEAKVRKTRNGSTMPDKCLVVYMNIHPSSMVKAYRRFSEQMDRHYEEAFLGTLNGSEASDMWIPFQRMRTTLMNCVQRCSARKLLVDVDIDGENRKESDWLLNEVEIFLGSQDPSIPRTVIRTQGGYHVLVPTVYLGKAVPLFQKLADLDKLTTGEVTFNSNAMVPVPGTLQAGKLVTIEN